MRQDFILFVLFVVSSSGACGDDRDGPADSGVSVDARSDYSPLPFEPTAATHAYCPDDDAAIEVRITELLAELSPAEKLALVHGTSGLPIDGVWPVSGSERLGVPGLHMLDGPRGLSSFSRKTATAFPVTMLRGATWDPSLEGRVGAAIAREHLSAGADVLLAPTMNLLRHPRWGRSQETYSEDTHHLGAVALAFIEGAQAEGVLATAKHFAANSIEDTRHRVNVEMEERTLRELYLPHFRRAVVEGRVASVMSAYNQFRGLYCDEQPHLLRDILKDEWGFAGFVVSDWIQGTHGSASSMLAGLDVEMPAGIEFADIPADIAAGRMSEFDLDDSVRRVLRAQLCFGLDTRGRTLDAPEDREVAEHLALAHEVAARGIVLLKNTPADDAPTEAAPVLPLDRGRVSEIAVLGRIADEENLGHSGSTMVTPSAVTTALAGITMAASPARVTHITGTTLDAAAEATVRAADAAIVVTGLTAEDEGERVISGGDRESLSIPAEEEALIIRLTEIHPAVIVVLEGGSAFTVRNFVDEVEALMWAGYPGAEGGHALAALLFGDEAPSGRLPFSMPRATADLPAFDNESDEVSYGFLHGYRHLAARGTAPEFAFGYGLGYTEFSMSELSVGSDTVGADETLVATVRVTNAGVVRGRHTVQLYVSALASAIERAPFDLRAFAQVDLDAGADAEVSLSLPVVDIAYWDDAVGGFVVEETEYEVLVGAYAGDPEALRARFTVTP